MKIVYWQHILAVVIQLTTARKLKVQAKASSFIYTTAEEAKAETPSYGQ